MKLSILIPTVSSRKAMLNRLITELWSQILPYSGEIEILYEYSDTLPIGVKRNMLLANATGDYLCFLDDDDFISVSYIQRLMDAIASNMDCASLKGLYSVNGVHDGVFEHSLKYNEWRTTGNDVKYERYPNHLNCIKSSIAKQFKFPETNFGEDHDWSNQVHESGLLRTEYYIDEVIYYYRKVTK